MNFITYMKFMIPVAIILAIILAVKKNADEYKQIRQDNPRMGKWEAFEQHMDISNARADAARKERREIREKKWLAQERAKRQAIDDYMDSEGYIKTRDEFFSGKSYYQKDGKTIEIDRDTKTYKEV